MSTVNPISFAGYNHYFSKDKEQGLNIENHEIKGKRASAHISEYVQPESNEHQYSRIEGKIGDLGYSLNEGLNHKFARVQFKNTYALIDNEGRIICLSGVDSNGKQIDYTA